MYLREIAMRSYVLLRSGWTVAQARDLLKRATSATHVVVHRTEPDLDGWLDAHAASEPFPALEDFYYLYTMSEIQALLKDEEETMLLRHVLPLHEYTATPAHDLYARADDAPDRAIVLDEGRLVGFYDATVPPVECRTFTGERAAGGEKGEAATRSLEAAFPEQVALHDTVSLLVSLSAEVQAGGKTPKSLPIVVPAGSAIDIVVQPGRGLQLVGRAEGQIVVTDTEQTLPLQFKLQAKELGPAKVRVLAFQDGQPLGAIPLAATVVERVAREEQAIVQQDLHPSSLSQPDLSLLIHEGYQDGKPTLTFWLTAARPELGLNVDRYGPVSLRSDPSGYINTLFQDIEELPLQTPQERAIAESKLVAKGATLFQQLIPREMQTLLWSLRDQIQSVWIQSEEPWIPWEICRLQGEEDGHIVGGPFFCEAFAVTRWFMGQDIQPRLSLNNVALVIPRDSGLPYARQERDYMLSLAAGSRQVQRIPATFPDVKEALAAGVYDGWHFTGHGGFRAPDPNRSVMRLEGRPDLRPEDLSGETQNLGRPRPLVFLNACQIGRSAFSLTGIGGWAAQFLRAGAAAFLGAFWSVYDRSACDFAQAFYGNLLGGMPIGRAAKEARLKIKTAGDPTWLAYTVYAHPLASVEG